MELIKKEKSWFLSKEGIENFSALSSLEDRTIFIYSYLKTVVNECFEKDNTLFKMAFFFADAIYNSKEKYATYPEVVQQDNPFFAYLEKSDSYHGQRELYLILISILHDKVDPLKRDEWIYDKDFWENEDFEERLEEKGIKYLSNDSVSMVEPSAYEIDQSKEFLQLVLVWLFLK